MSTLLKFLEVNGLSQNEIADYLGVGAPTISKICTGMHKLPAKRRLQLLENTNGWDVSSLLEKEENEIEDENSIFDKEIDELNQENERLNAVIADKDAEIAKLQAQNKILTERAVFLEQAAELWSKIAVGKDQLCKEKERIIQMMENNLNNPN